MAVQIESFATDLELAQHAARRWLAWAVTHTAQDRHPTVALAGGRITGTFYDALCREATPAAVEAARAVEYFWGDERCVPPSSADSNFKLALDRFFTPLGIPAARQHRLAGELPPQAAAQQAAAELSQCARRSAGGRPSLDLVLLGLGEDGHVASLFPGAGPEVLAAEAVYLPVVGPKPPPQRISLSYPQLAAAGEVWVLVAGAGKLPPLREALAGATSHGLGRVLAQRAQTRIFESVGHGG
jgi:6-phosphogluconolactonase